MNQIAKTTPAAMTAALFGARSDVEAAQTPRETKAALTKAEAIRDMLHKAMDLAGDEAPHLAQLRREAEQVALSAMLKLGAMAPRNPEGRPANGQELVSMTSFATSAGVSCMAARRMARLADSFAVYPEHFASIVDRALSAGQPVPLGKLRKLADPEPAPDETPCEPAPRAGMTLDGLCKLIEAAMSYAADLKCDEGAQEVARKAASAVLDGMKPIYGRLDRARMGEAK